VRAIVIIGQGLARPDMLHYSVFMLDIALKDMADHVCELVANSTYCVDAGELTFNVQKDGVLEILQTLRDDRECVFTSLIDITAVDWLGHDDRPRFEVVYNLLSISHNIRARVHVDIAEGENMPTATGLWECADWYEREAWDMYGIAFEGHLDLRRMLCDYDFDVHAQRKDFPVYGNVEVKYDPSVRRVTYGKVELNQEYRKFDTCSPMQSMTDIQIRLPGDEKAE